MTELWKLLKPERRKELAKRFNLDVETGKVKEKDDKQEGKGTNRVKIQS